MKHLVLLGDSIFDNGRYVEGEPDVIAHLRRQIPSEWTASLRAQDGSLVEHVQDQTRDLPADTTHLIVSSGGNNALMNIGILQQKASSSSDVLNKMSYVADTFEYHYREMLQAVLSLNKPTAVCTIYYPRMQEPLMQKLAVAGLTIFNDVIIKQAFLAGVPLIDLRLVCNEAADFANEIEPSAGGGEKIAAAIVRLVHEHVFENGRTEVFV